MYLEIFLADFAVFRGNTWISRVRDRAKYQKPWLMYDYECKTKENLHKIDHTLD